MLNINIFNRLCYVNVSIFYFVLYLFLFNLEGNVTINFFFSLNFLSIKIFDCRPGFF